MRQPITPELTQTILGLHDAGQGYRTIGKAVGRHFKTIRDVVKRNRLTTADDYDPEPRQGIDVYYGEVRVRWREDEFKRLMDVLEAKRKESRL